MGGNKAIHWWWLWWVPPFVALNAALGLWFVRTSQNGPGQSCWHPGPDLNGMTHAEAV